MDGARIRPQDPLFGFICIGLVMAYLLVAFVSVRFHDSTPRRMELRCSAYVTPPKGCTP
jgi:hypothetical protein